MLAHSLFFYFFSGITVFSAIMVIISKNTVYSVFFLILVFISTSILFIMIGAEFLGIIPVLLDRNNFHKDFSRCQKITSLENLELKKLSLCSCFKNIKRPNVNEDS